MSTSKNDTDEQDAGVEQDVELNRARRRLLKYAVYVPPAVIGALSLAESGCQGSSCGPANCAPNITPCSPSGCPPNN